MSQFDYTAYAGDSIEITIDVIDEDGAALNVTGAAVTYALAVSPYQDALVSKTTVDGITIDGAEIVIMLAPADTTGIMQHGERFHHECEIVDSGGKVFTVVYGNVHIKRTVIDGND